MDLFSLKYNYLVDTGSEMSAISERVMNEPNIVDCVDYKENLSYVNEISLTLNNEDGLMYNGQDGLFDTLSKLQLLVTMIPDNGAVVGKKSFGGYIDIAKIKPDFVKKTISISAYSYLGEMDRISSLKVSRRYMKGGNLYLYNLRIVVKNASPNGHELEEGRHTIETKLDGNTKYARLDDGEWVVLPLAADATLYSRDGLQAVIIREYEGLAHTGTQDIIVKHKGDQYPYVNYYDAGLFEVMKKCLDESGVTNYTLSPYEIKTFDSRKIISKYENIDFEYYQGLISDGDQTIYVMLGDKVWQRNIVTQEWTNIFTEPDNMTVVRLEKFGNNLFVYIGTAFLFIRLYKVNLTNNTSVKLFEAVNNPIYVSANTRNAFNFSSRLNKFIFLASDGNGANPRICTLDLSGNITTVVGISDLVCSGFNFVWESSAFLHFYYLTFAPNPYLKRITYDFNTNTFGSPEDLGFWYAWQGVTNLHVYGFYWPEREQLFFRAESNGNESFIYNLQDNTFLPDAEINPDGYVLYTPFLQNGILSVIAKKTNPAELKTAHFSHDLLVIDDDFSGSGITLTEYATDFQKVATSKNYQNYDIITFVDESDKSLKRFSEWFIPYLKGELNFSDGTIRQIIDECVKTFLGYFYITPEKQAFYFKRDEYTGGSAVIFDLTNKSRIMESLYSEKYDKIITKNEETYAEYGITSIESKALSVDLKYIDTAVLKDIAKYFHDYYSVARKLYTIDARPSYYTAAILDTASMIAYGLSNGVIHEINPKRSSCKIKILVADE